VFDWDRSYFGYHDSWIQKAPTAYLRDFARYILYFGLLMSMLGIRLNQKVMITVMFFGNVVLSMSSLFMPFRRYGPDFTAYVN